MCGLAGIITNNSVSTLEKGVFNNLLLTGCVRGLDSTGVMAIGDRADVWHACMPSYDLLSDGRYKKWEGSIPLAETRAWMAHHRAATSGGKEGLSTVHPFNHGDIWLMMNGTVRDRTCLVNHKEFAGRVDSDNVAFSVAKIGIEETLKTLNSPFALAWFDLSDRSVNLVRNSERPLYIVKDGTLWAYASEKEMLLWLMNRRWANNTLNESFELEVGTQLKFTWNEHKVVQLEKIKRELYVPKSVIYSTDYSRGYNRRAASNYDMYDIDDYDDVQPHRKVNNAPQRADESVIITPKHIELKPTPPVVINQNHIQRLIEGTKKSKVTEKQRVQVGNAIFDKYKHPQRLGELVEISLWDFEPFKNSEGKRGAIVGMVEGVDVGYIGVVVPGVTEVFAEQHTHPNEMTWVGQISGVFDKTDSDQPHPVVYINPDSLRRPVGKNIAI